jgi:WD40 repeat protein
MEGKPIPPDSFVQRPAVYHRLVKELTDPGSFGPVAISTALPGVRGFGKTTLAEAVCGDPQILEAFPDGVVWVSLASDQADGSLSGLETIRRLDELLVALTGQPSALTEIEVLTARLHEVMHPRSLLLVIDDAANKAVLERFLHSGPSGACLIITRDPTCLPMGTREVHVDAMHSGEAEALLASGLIPGQEVAPEELAAPENQAGPTDLTDPALKVTTPLGEREVQAAAVEEVDPLLAGLPLPSPAATSTADAGTLAALKRVEQKKHITSAGIPPEAVEPLLAISTRLNSWPLLLALVNGLMRGNALGAGENGWQVPATYPLANEARTMVRMIEGLVEKWKLADEQARRRVLDSILTACQNAFNPAERARYRELVVFPAHQAIPVAAVYSLWSTGDSPLPDARGLVTRLAIYRLIEMDPEANTIHLPGELRAQLLRGFADEELFALQGRLVDAYAANSPGDWAAGPDDGYFFRWLPHHLVESGRRSDLQALLFRYTWLSAFLGSRSFIPGDLYRLLGFYDMALSTSLDRQSASLRLVREALHLSLPVLAQDRTQLAAQLLGRLLVFDDPDIQTIIDQAAAWTGQTWLRPLSACFNPPGSSEVRTLEGHREWVTAVAVLPDGRFAISGSLDGTLRIWDLAIGQVLRELQAHPGGVLSVAVTPDGVSAISGGMDGKIRIWDLNRGEEKITIRAHAQPVGALVVTLNGDFIISGSDDHNIRVWETFSGERIHEFSGHTEPVRALALTPDGRALISGSWDNTVRIWDLDNGQQLHVLKGHTGWVRSIAVSPDGYNALSSGWDRTLRVWDLWTGEEIRKIDTFTTPVFALAVMQDQKTIVAGTGDGKLRLLDFETGAEKIALQGHTGGINSLAITPSERFVISAADDCTLRIWDLLSILGSTYLSTGRTQPTHSAAVYSLELLADGQHSLSASWDGTLKVWDLQTAQEVGALTGHSGGVVAVALDSAGRYALSGSRDHTLKLWDLSIRQEVRTLAGHDAPVTCVAMTPDGRYGVSGANDGTLKAWDLETGDCLAVFHGDTEIWACRFSADGQTIVASGSGGKMYFLKLTRQN